MWHPDQPTLVEATLLVTWMVYGELLLAWHPMGCDHGVVKGEACTFE